MCERAAVLDDGEQVVQRRRPRGCRFKRELAKWERAKWERAKWEFMQRRRPR